MSSATAAPDPVATGAPPMGPGGPGSNGTADVLPGVPISDRAAYLAQVYIGVSSVLMLLCVIAFVTRIYQRVRPVWKAGLDDYFIVAGFVRLPRSGPFPPEIQLLTAHSLTRPSPSPTTPCSCR